MAKEQASLRAEKSDFTEEHTRPTIGYSSLRKRQIIISSVVVSIFVIAVIIAIVEAVIVTQSDITSTCWKKEQCYTCLKGPNGGDVGWIKGIPVCCPKCERNGLNISSNKCDCRIPTARTTESVTQTSTRSTKYVTQTSDITGTCWKKEQCYTCLNGPNSGYVGYMNGIPVCCPQCGRYGLNMSPNSCDCRFPTAGTTESVTQTSAGTTESVTQTSDITGTCWKKEQCYTCLEGPNSGYVGYINGIPVCCPQCGRHGLRMSPNSCDCPAMEPST